MPDDGVERLDTDMGLASGNGGNKLLIVLVMVSTLVAIVAIVIAAVALTRPSNPNITVGGPAGGAPPPPITVLSSGGSSGASKDVSWDIVMGHDWGAHEYFDSKGFIKGFSKDLITSVCQAGGLKCNMIWAPYTQCWDSKPATHPFGGQGLLDRWYDACTGWVATYERIHVFDFSMPYLDPQLAQFFKKKGSSFTSSNLDGKKIIFLTGWAMDEKCLARQQDSNHLNYVLNKTQIVYVDTPEIAIQKLNNSEGDAIFSTVIGFEKYANIVENLPNDQFSCAVSGNGMMFRKDSDFGAAWNEAFQKFRSSGGFQKLCEAAGYEHGSQGTIHCID